MDRELLDHYNRELALLYEYAADFAEEYPGVAERLGGLTRERADPMIAGLLDGTALLAARVQLKLKHEFPEFTFNLLEQLLPNYLAPIPSIMLAKINPTFGDPALREGRTIAAGANLDAIYREKEKNVSCRFTMSEDVTFWPFDISRAEYLPAASGLQALRLNTDASVTAGLRLTLRLRTAQRVEDEPAENTFMEDPLLQMAGCRVDDLKFNLVGPEADAVMLYEQFFAHLVGVHLRYVDSFGDPQFASIPAGNVEQIGFGDNDTIFPYDNRVFQGFSHIQDYFVFPRKFLGFRLKGLQRALANVRSNSVDILFTFSRSMPRLAASVTPSMFALYAGAAVNLFAKNSDRVQLKPGQFEYHVVLDRSQMANFEAHRILDVFLHYPGRAEKRRVKPLYRLELDQGSARDVSFSFRRLPRRRSSDERRFGSSSDYNGTDTFVALTPPHIDTDGTGTVEMSVRAMCSNRHLAQHLPVGQGGADFKLRDDTSLEIVAIIPPTPPREAPVTFKHDSAEHMGIGPVAWRMINMLSLNHLGLKEKDARAIREILTMFADLTDAAIERRIRGVRSIETRPVIRRLAQRAGVGVARGMEVTVTLEEKAFEGTGVFLLGAVLDRFFAEYAAINHFTQTVIRSVERGEIVRWKPRSGSRDAL